MSNRTEILARAEKAKVRNEVLMRIGVGCFLIVCLMAMAISQTSFSRSTNLAIIVTSIGLSIVVVLTYAIKSAPVGDRRGRVVLTLVGCIVAAMIMVMYFAYIAWPT